MLAARPKIFVKIERGTASVQILIPWMREHCSSFPKTWHIYEKRTSTVIYVESPLSVYSTVPLLGESLEVDTFLVVLT